MKQYFFRNFLILLLLTFSFFSARAIHAFAAHYTSDDKSITIVIDPGHGGPDPGKISPSGILEKDINLQISSTLKTLLKNRGYNVIMTRYDDNDLSSENSKHTKVDDLAKRVSIMSQDDVSLVVSIHQNSFQNTTSCGPQVFYYEKSKEGKALASHILNSMNNSLDISDPRTIKSNLDYYILKNSTAPAVIVECGFLSNPTETKLLSDEHYQLKLCRSIYLGIINYLDQKSS